MGDTEVAVVGAPAGYWEFAASVGRSYCVCAGSGQAAAGMEASLLVGGGERHKDSRTHSGEGQGETQTDGPGEGAILKIGEAADEEEVCRGEQNERDPYAHSSKDKLVELLRDVEVAAGVARGLHINQDDLKDQRRGHDSTKEGGEAASLGEFAKDEGYGEAEEGGGDAEFERLEPGWITHDGSAIEHQSN